MYYILSCTKTLLVRFTIFISILALFMSPAPRRYRPLVPSKSWIWANYIGTLCQIYIPQSSIDKKKCIRFEYTPRRHIPQSYKWFTSSLPSISSVRHSIIEMSINIFFDLVTFTYELELDILPLDLRAKIQVCMSVPSARIARRTDRHTDRQTMSKLLHQTYHRRGV